MSEHFSSLYSAGAPSEARPRPENIFTPVAPATRRTLFAPRPDAADALRAAISGTSTSVVVHGEAGVGKTTLVLDTLHAAGAASWRTDLRAGDDLPALASRLSVGASTPEALAAQLTARAAGAAIVLVLDAFDAAAPALRDAILATVRALPANLTCVLTGTAYAPEAWRADESVPAVRVTRIGEADAIAALANAFAAIGRGVDDAVLERVVTLANGLPGVLHALGAALLRAADADGAAVVGDTQLERAVAAVVAAAPDAVSGAYEQSIVRARRGIFPEILLACALSPRDEAGAFSAADVRDTLQRIVRREVRGLTNQVGALTETGRGAVLEKHGLAREARYRFVTPAIEPYILMRGLEPGWATAKVPVWMPVAAEAVSLPRAA